MEKALVWSLTKGLDMPSGGCWSQSLFDLAFWSTVANWSLTRSASLCTALGSRYGNTEPSAQNGHTWKLMKDRLWKWGLQLSLWKLRETNIAYQALEMFVLQQNKTCISGLKMNCSWAWCKGYFPMCNRKQWFLEHPRQGAVCPSPRTCLCWAKWPQTVSGQGQPATASVLTRLHPAQGTRKCHQPARDRWHQIATLQPGAHPLQPEGMQRCRQWSDAPFCSSGLQAGAANFLHWNPSGFLLVYFIQSTELEGDVYHICLLLLSPI